MKRLKLLPYFICMLIILSSCSFQPKIKTSKFELKSKYGIDKNTQKELSEKMLIKYKEDSVQEYKIIKTLSIAGLSENQKNSLYKVLLNQDEEFKGKSKSILKTTKIKNIKTSVKREENKIIYTKIYDTSTSQKCKQLKDKLNISRDRIGSYYFSYKKLKNDLINIYKAKQIKNKH